MSNECKDFLDKIFLLKGKERKSINSLIEHPWIKNNQNESFEESLNFSRSKINHVSEIKNNSSIISNNFMIDYSNRIYNRENDLFKKNKINTSQIEFNLITESVYEKSSEIELENDINSSDLKYKKKRIEYQKKLMEDLMKNKNSLKSYDNDSF